MADLLIANNSVPATGADLKPASGTPQFATSGNPINLVPATIWPAYAANMIMSELYNIVLASGITPSGSDWAQVWQAMLCTGVFQDVGTENAMRTLLPNIVNQPGASSVFHNLRVGTRIRVIVAHTNTSSTVTLDALNIGAVNVVRLDGNPLHQGDLPVGQIVEFVYDGTHWRGLGQLNILPNPPQAGLIVYVRTDGNDNNNGLTNTSGGAYATIQGAISGVSNQYALPPNRTVGVVLGQAGTYSGNFDTPPGSSFLFTGLTNSPSSYIISGGQIPRVDVVSAAKGASVFLEQLTVQNISNIQNWVNAQGGGNLSLQNVNFSQTSGPNPFDVIKAFAGGSIICLNVIFTSCNASALWQAAGSGANIVISSDAISNAQFVGNNVVAQGTAFVSETGTIQVGTWSTSGGVTGPRYLAQFNGVITSSGQGVNLFPGTIAGTPPAGTDNVGGWYIP